MKTRVHKDYIEKFLDNLKTETNLRWVGGNLLTKINPFEKDDIKGDETVIINLTRGDSKTKSSITYSCDIPSKENCVDHDEFLGVCKLISHSNIDNSHYAFRTKVSYEKYKVLENFFNQFDKCIFGRRYEDNIIESYDYNPGVDVYLNIESYVDKSVIFTTIKNVGEDEPNTVDNEQFVEIAKGFLDIEYHYNPFGPKCITYVSPSSISLLMKSIEECSDIKWKEGHKPTKFNVFDKSFKEYNKIRDNGDNIFIGIENKDDEFYLVRGIISNVPANQAQVLCNSYFVGECEVHLPKPDDAGIMIFREILFRGRKKEDGEWIEGSYHHNIEKGSCHQIIDRDTNTLYEIYRESLQIYQQDGFYNI